MNRLNKDKQHNLYSTYCNIELHLNKMNIPCVMNTNCIIFSLFFMTICQLGSSSRSAKKGLK